MKKVEFKSKIGFRLFALIFLMLAAPLVFFIIKGIWIVVGLILLFAIIPIAMLVHTKYEVTENRLRIVCGLFYQKEIQITAITKIEVTTNPISSPALSLDRLEIRLSKFDSVLVSPKEKETFLNTLLQINPTIELKQ